MTAATIEGVEAIRERIVDAATRGVPVRVVGRGTWLDAGAPVNATATVSTREVTGIVEYVPGDLTLTARSGTTLGEIRDATARENQWLALDPFGADEGTLGATVATGSAGPLATAIGSPRDLLLGIEMVAGTGAVVRAGGRVVKNVAGFDITRLVAGSWGTLGVITEVALRLHARPAVDETVVIALDDGAAGMERVRKALRESPFKPYACEVLNPALAAALGVGSGPVALTRIAGNDEAVAAQRTALRQIGEPRAAAHDVWTRLRGIEPAGASVLRFSRRPSQLPGLWQLAEQLAATCPGTLVHAAAARGVVRCIVPANGAGALADALANAGTATCIAERLPAELRRHLRASRPDAVRDRLTHGVKQAFDPAGVLNPGIWGDLA
jgi:glycolate oxidase FAD binding subunit